MSEVFTEMMRSWEEPATRHAMIVHVPIVLSILAVFFVALSFIVWRCYWPRVLAVVALLALAGSAYMAQESGHDAEAAAGVTITLAASPILDTHHDMGHWPWIFALVAAGVFCLTFIPKRPVRVLASLASIGVVIFGAGWVAVTSHYGGQLVYEHGVGVARAPVAPSDVLPVEDPETGETDAATDGEEQDEPDNPSEGLGHGQVDPADPRMAFFRESVLPILEQKCWGCHTAARAARSGGLNLSLLDSILRGGVSGQPAIVPGDVEGSQLIVAIHYEDPFLEMPPRRNGKLPDEEIAVLERWVRDGAVWDDAAVSARFAGGER